MGRTRTGLATVHREATADATDDEEHPTTVGTGSDSEFEDWYRGLHPRIVAAVLMSTGRVDDAADVADETMVRALERWDRVRTMASRDGWAFRVAFNLVRRRGRRRALEATLLRRSAAGRSTTIDGPAGEAWDAVRHLSERQRQTIVLRYVADLPEAEIAAALGISRGTVSSTLADARAALRLSLGDEPPPTTTEPATDPTTDPATDERSAR
jgi:RNA polymerase sigma factor (sigma-70 family)